MKTLIEIIKIEAGYLFPVVTEDTHLTITAYLKNFTCASMETIALDNHLELTLETVLELRSKGAKAITIATDCGSYTTIYMEDLAPALEEFPVGTLVRFKDNEAHGHSKNTLWHIGDDNCGQEGRLHIKVEPSRRNWHVPIDLFVAPSQLVKV